MNEFTRALTKFRKYKLPIANLKQICVCHASRNLALNLVLNFKLASSQSEAFIKLDNLSYNKNSLKYLSGLMRLVLKKFLIICVLTGKIAFRHVVKCLGFQSFKISAFAFA